MDTIIENTGVQQQFISQLKQFKHSFVENKTIHQLFSEQASRTPEKEAIICGSESISYQALDQQTNRLARHLRQVYSELSGRPLTKDTLIAVCINKSIDMFVAILSILKAGAAYVPLSPAHPQKHLDFILRDTNVKLMLTNRSVSEQRLFRIGLIMMDHIQSLEESDAPLDPLSRDGDLACVLYTSGTTGTPKGVLIEHRNICNLIQIRSKTFCLSHHSRCSQIANYVFDAFLYETFPGLSLGATIFIALQDDILDAQSINTFFNTHRITNAFFPTSLYKQIEDQLEACWLKIAHVGGERLCGLTKQPTFMLVNIYGPTETTVACTHYHVTDINDIYLGQPLPNTRLYLLDSELQPVKMGEKGELYIAGAGVSRGYLNRPELERERFINNPYADINEKGYQTLYKTGDILSWCSNGQLQFHGRDDFQIKLRGHRIETGGIETILATYPGIKLCLVKPIQQANSETISGDVV